MLSRLVASAAFAAICGCGASDEAPLGSPDNARLQNLRSESKFAEFSPTLYPGAPTEVVRVRCERALNRYLEDLLDLTSRPWSKQLVMNRTRTLLVEFQSEDSEERDRLLDYLEETLEAVGIESSDGLLNEWRYGFDPS